MRHILDYVLLDSGIQTCLSFPVSIPLYVMASTTSATTHYTTETPEEKKIKKAFGGQYVRPNTIAVNITKMLNNTKLS